MSASVVPAAELLDWWFADARDDPERAAARNAFWFGSDPAADRGIRERFGATLEAAAAGELDAWAEEPRGRLALVLVFDQLPRNIHRGSARAFAYDARALALAREGVATGALEPLSVPERAFLLMPFMHAESVPVQREACEHFEALVAGAPPAWRSLAENNLAFARDHLAICERFGRFPHRNAALGREATPEERAFLEGGGASFGQA